MSRGSPVDDVGDVGLRTVKEEQKNMRATLREFASVNFTNFWDFVANFLTTWSIHDQPIPSFVALKLGFLEVENRMEKTRGSQGFQGLSEHDMDLQML